MVATKLSMQDMEAVPTKYWFYKPTKATQRCDDVLVFCSPRICGYSPYENAVEGFIIIIIIISGRKFVKDFHKTSSSSPVKE